MSKKAKRNRKSRGELLSYFVVAVLSMLLLAMISLRIYLATALPAPQLSRFLSSYLHQKVSIGKIRLRDGAIVLEQVRLQNPPGFPQGDLAAADAVALEPQWGNLLLGRQRFSSIGLDGIRVNLQENGKGLWNFAQLQQILAAKKSKKETYIKDLAVANGAVTVHGEGLRGISLHVFDLTTKGSASSSVDFTFQDPAHNSYSIKGTARGGSAAAMDLTLNAPDLNLKGVAASLKMKNARLLEGSKGALQVIASFRKGELTSTGELRFAGLRLPAAQKNYPVAGVLDFAADYNVSSDTARLTNLALAVKNLARLHATGRMTGVRRERLFTMEVSMDETDLATLNLLIPEDKRKQLLVGGRVRCDRLQIEGSRGMGLETATGTVQLEEGSLTKEGRLLAEGISGSIGIFGQDSLILATGRLTSAGGGENVLVSGADLPFSVELSAKLQPVSAEVPALSATVAGVPLRGKIGYHAAGPTPITARVVAASLDLPKLNPQLKRYGIEASSGVADVAVDLTGKDSQDLVARVESKLRHVTAGRAGVSYALKAGSLTAELKKAGGSFTAKGHAVLASLAVAGRTATGRFAFDYADHSVQLSGLHATLAGADLAVSRLSTTIPAKQVAGSLTRYPLSIDLGGCTLKQGEFELQNLSGRLRGVFNVDGGKWLEATAELASDALYRQRKKIAAPVAHLAFSRAGASAVLGGKMLEGKLSGSASLDPFALEKGGGFDLAVSGAQAASAAAFLAKGGGFTPNGGLLDLRLKGSYSKRDGLACRFQGRGSGIGLTGSGGKTVLSGGALAVAGAIAKGTLSITNASFAPGPGVALNAKGEVANAFSSHPVGAFSFELPQASLNSLVDPFVNLLPRFIQGATLSGSIAAGGKITLLEGKKLVQGTLAFSKDRLEVAAQNLAVGEVNGNLPFSFDLSGKTGGKPQDSLSFSRDNYQRLLQKLRQGSGGGDVVSIDRLDFGALKFGKLTLHLKGENGLTQITSLDTSLAEGKILGTGYLKFGNKINYRSDLLISDVSLKALCGMFPGIKGYISGKVDGVVSIDADGKGLSALTGFVDLWAHEARGEKMLVSKEFLQRLSKQKMTGFFFRSDRPYDQAEIKAMLEEGDLTFDTLSIQHTNFFGVRDLSVSIAPTQNRIGLDHLFESIKEASTRGKASTGATGAQPQPAEPAAPSQEFKWGE
jgi:hypothetical protein